MNYFFVYLFFFVSGFRVIASEKDIKSKSKSLSETLSVSSKSSKTRETDKSHENVNSVKSIVYNKKWLNNILELDEIQREIVWLLTQKRPLINKTMFGKIYRALQTKNSIKLKNKNIFACDVYEVELQKNKIKIFEHCQKSRKPDLLAEIELITLGIGEKKKGVWRRLSFDFNGQNFSEIIGLQASLVSPRVHCEVDYNAQAQLKKIECTGFKWTRGVQVVELSRYYYDANKSPPIFLEGKVLENLLIHSKLTVEVPTQGKIVIRETKIRPDADEIDPRLVKKETDTSVIKNSHSTNNADISQDRNNNLNSINSNGKGEETARQTPQVLTRPPEPLNPTDGNTLTIPVDESGNPVAPRELETSESSDISEGSDNSNTSEINSQELKEQIPLPINPDPQSNSPRKYEPELIELNSDGSPKTLAPAIQSDSESPDKTPAR